MLVGRLNLRCVCGKGMTISSIKANVCLAGTCRSGLSLGIKLDVFVRIRSESLEFLCGRTTAVVR